MTARGRGPVGEFLDGLSPKARSEVIDLLSLLESGRNLTMPYSRSLGSIFPGLHELRLRDERGEARLMYLVRGKRGIFVVHGFRKRSRKIPLREIEQTLQRLKEI